MYFGLCVCVCFGLRRVCILYGDHMISTRVSEKELFPPIVGVKPCPSFPLFRVCLCLICLDHFGYS